MNQIIDRIKNFFKLNAKAPVQTAAPAQRFVPYDFLSSMGASAPAPMDLRAQIDAGRFSWPYACITKIAAEVANIHLVLYRQKNGKIEVVPKHEALDNLDRANNFMTRYDLFELLAIFLESAGECFWWKMKDKSGKIINIYPWLNPCYMQVVPSAETFVGGYIYTIPGTGEKIPFEADQIVHFKYPDPLNPYRGLSPIKAAEYEISTSKQVAKWNWRFFRNAARPFGVILYDGTMSDDQFKRVKSQMEIGMNGEENAHKLAILEKAKDYKEVGYSQKDMDFFNQRNWSRDEILAIFKVPKTALTLTEGSNRATAEAQKAVFIEETIVPKMRKIVSYLNEFFLSDFGEEGLFFDFDNPAPRDVELNIKYYQAGLNYGFLTPNEIREMEGMDPVEGGDSLYIPFSLSAIGASPEEDHEDQDKKFKNKKFNVRPWRRLTDEKIKQIIKENLPSKLKARFEKLQKSQFKKEETKIQDEEKDFSKDFREKYAEYIVRRADAEEKNFKAGLVSQFKRQEKSVLDSLKEKGKAIKAGVNFKFDVKKEREIFIEFFSPKLLDVLKRHGQEAIDMVGGDGEFSTQGERIDEFFESHGLKFAQEVNKETRRRIIDAIAAGISAGEGIAKIKDRVSEVFKAATETRSELIARTEVSRASNFATQEGYKQSGVVRAKEWLTAADERLCEFCAAMDGKIIGLDENFFDKGDEMSGENGNLKLDYENVASPPLHPNCRCTLIPVIKGSKAEQNFSKKSEEDLAGKLEGMFSDLKEKELKEIGEIKEKIKQVIEENEEQA